MLFAIININYIVSVTSSLPPWSSTKQNPTLFDFLLPLVSLWFQFYHCEYYIQYLSIFDIITNKPNRIIRPEPSTADTPIFLQPLLCPLVSLHFQFNYQQSDIPQLSIFYIFTNKPNRIIHSKLPPPTPPYFYSLCYVPSFRYIPNSTISNPI